MTLKEFLKKVGGRVESIITYAGNDALKAVEQNGYALQYVKDQTPEVCLKAVERNGYALRYVNKGIFEADGNTKKTVPCPHCSGSGTIEE
jgi:hypothetical protein